LSGKNNPPIDSTGLIIGESAFNVIYINNSNFFFASNPLQGDNEHGTCGSVAAQLLLSYNNYYNDRRIIAPEHLNGEWHNGNKNYKYPDENPNACADPMLMTRQTTGSNNAYYNALITAIEPGAFSCCKPSPKYDADGVLVHSHPGSTTTQVTNGMRNILNSRNISHFTNSYANNEANVKAQINSNRPLIIGMAKSLGGYDHWVIGYGYGDFTYPAEHPNAGLTRSGFITHFGWSSDKNMTDNSWSIGRNNVWINSAWCDYYITMQINHTHNFISTGTFHNGKIILRCNTCKHRKTEANNIFASGKGTPDDPFIITTASHLNNVRDYYSRYFKLGNDIDLQNVQWTPIPSFEGTFEGNGKTIRNLKMVYSPANSSGYGLFINNNNTIQNLKVTANINFQNYTSGYVEIAISVGVIAVNNYGVIYSCQVSASSGDPMIYCKTGFTGTVGGITARNFGAINRSDNNGIIYSSGNTGGIAGYNGNSIMTCNNNALICYSYVDNRITKTHSIGGIAGTNYSSISNVTNTAMILYGGYSQLNDNQLQPRMAHITGSNFGTINNSSWHGGSVNKGLLINYSWTQSGVTYTHDQALYVRSAATGL